MIFIGAASPCDSKVVLLAGRSAPRALLGPRMTVLPLSPTIPSSSPALRRPPSQPLSGASEAILELFACCGGRFRSHSEPRRRQTPFNSLQNHLKQRHMSPTTRVRQQKTPPTPRTAPADFRRPLGLPGTTVVTEEQILMDFRVSIGRQNFQNPPISQKKNPESKKYIFLQIASLDLHAAF